LIGALGLDPEPILRAVVEEGAQVDIRSARARGPVNLDAGAMAETA
jgi:hypothetical protein